MTQYLLASTALEAQETLTLLKAQDWSAMKQDVRNSFWNELKKKAFPSSIKPKPVESLSNEDLAQWLRGALRG